MQKVTEKRSRPRRDRPRRPAVDPGGLLEGVRDRLGEFLPEEALQDVLKGLDAEEITGQGGLLSQLAGRVINAALEGELTDHLGYPPGQPPPGGTGNVRNGSTPKMVNTELGPLDVKTPRDRQGGFDPKLVAKRQTRWPAWMTGSLACTPAGCVSVTSRLTCSRSTGRDRPGDD